MLSLQEIGEAVYLLHFCGWEPGFLRVKTMFFLATKYFGYKVVPSPGAEPLPSICPDI